jgi:hypothetical protein
VASGKACDLRTALREADWEALLPRLVDYTERRLRRLRWVVGRDEEPTAVSVQEMINDAIDRCLTGSRTWNADDPPELGAFLCGVIKSISSTAKKAAVRSKVDPIEDVGAAIADPTPSIQNVLEEEEGTRAICATFEACMKGDEKLELLYLAVLDRNVKREDIAEALGWAVDEVTAARNKLQRRLISQFPAQFASYKKTRVRS